MTHDNVMSTPIFDELLREMAQRSDPHTPAPSTTASATPTTPEPPKTPTRHRYRPD